MATMILWTKFVMEEQGYNIERNVLYQDNKSAIQLETNGKKSSSKRTRALKIRYFFLTDQVEKGNLSVGYCPTSEMIGDFMTKPLQGKKFELFRDMIMGIKCVSSPPTAAGDDRSVLEEEVQLQPSGSPPGGAGGARAFGGSAKSRTSAKSRGFLARRQKRRT
jgi:hypothetical protein